MPAIVECIPYRKRDGTAWRDGIMQPYVAGHGYAVLRLVYHCAQAPSKLGIDYRLFARSDPTHRGIVRLVGDDAEESRCSFKARLQILGVIREDVGTGRDYKQAATDAFKRAAVRFGVAHELYAYEQNWVQVDGDGKYAKPVEEPADAYARRVARAAMRTELSIQRAEPTDAADIQIPAATGPLALDEPSCPKSGGRMWDNRLSKRNPKAPDYKCRNRSCDGVIWPPRSGAQAASAEMVADAAGTERGPESNEDPF